MEEWKCCMANPMYEVSTEGRIKNGITGRVLKPQTSARGYLSVQLGRGVRHYVHRLVAYAFIMNEEDKPEVAHNNGITGDNRVANLRWATAKENMADKKRHGTHGEGEQHSCAKLSEEDVRTIRAYQGHQGELAKRYNVSEATVSMLKHGKTWKHLTP